MEEVSNVTEPTREKPYPSWTWVVNELGEGYWDAPKPAPSENGVTYAWNEEITDWVKVTQ
jgi:hypothetical protein